LLSLLLLLIWLLSLLLLLIWLLLCLLPFHIFQPRRMRCLRHVEANSVFQESSAVGFFWTKIHKNPHFEGCGLEPSQCLGESSSTSTKNLGLWLKRVLLRLLSIRL
jgi:hypothetical protein